MTTHEGTHAQVELARSLLRQRKAVEAIAALSQVARCPDATADTLELLAVAYTMSGNASFARKAFEKALEMDRGRATTHYNYALFLMAQNELDEAAEENAAALYLSPQHSGAQALRKQLSEKLRDRRYVAEEGFSAIGNGGNRFKEPPKEWAKLQCVVCGGMNYITARTCSRCGSLLPEIEEIIPVE